MQETGLTILSSMVTPTVLILATGSLLLTTSQRLGRSIERARKLLDQLENFGKSEGDEVYIQGKRKVLFDLLGMATKRSRYLQSAMTILYIALSIFVSTIIIIGVIEITEIRFPWLPLILGMLGAGLLFYSSLFLMAESRIALQSVKREMDFMVNASREHVPEDFLQMQKSSSWFPKFKFNKGNKY